MEKIGTVRIKLSDGMVRELKHVRYVPQFKKNLILVGALEAQGLRETLEKGVLKMFSGLLVVLKDVRRNNLYYLKSSTEIEILAVSECFDGDSIRL